MWSILWVVCFSTYICAQFNMVSEPRCKRKLSSLDLLLDHFWAKLLLPALHQKQKVYHLIPQVKELLIDIDQLCYVWWKPKMCRLSTLRCPFCVFCMYKFEWIHQFLFSPCPQTMQNGWRRWFHLWWDKVSVGCLLDSVKSVLVRLTGWIKVMELLEQ